MSRSAFEFDDAAFLAGLQRTLTGQSRTAVAVVREVGEQVAQAAHAAAPTESGRMAESIHSEVGRDRRGPYADVSVGPFYSSFVEFGRSARSARPFFRPALEQARRLLAAKAGRFR